MTLAGRENETCWTVFRRIDGSNLSEVLRGLPAPLRDEFAGWAQQNFGDDRDRAEFLIRGADHPNLEEALAAVRAWLMFG